MKFKVIRIHQGDRLYVDGDVREAEFADVKHLVPHVLKPLEKSESPPRNKAEGAAPANKADNGRKAKS